MNRRLGVAVLAALVAPEAAPPRSSARPVTREYGRLAATQAERMRAAAEAARRIP